MARKLWLVVCAIAVASWLSCRVPEHRRHPEKYYRQTPSKTESHEVLSGGQVLGYVHKYEWETAEGEKPHYYVVYERKGNLIGRIRKDGYTVQYTKDGKEKELGHFALVGALERIYDVPHVQVTRADQDAEYLSWRNPSTASAQTKPDSTVPRPVKSEKPPEEGGPETEETTEEETTSENDESEGEGE